MKAKNLAAGNIIEYENELRTVKEIKECRWDGWRGYTTITLKEYGYMITISSETEITLIG